MVDRIVFRRYHFNVIYEKALGILLPQLPAIFVFARALMSCSVLIGPNELTKMIRLTC